MAKRVLLVNKFYYPRGGDCVVVINTEQLLRDNGVDAEVFAMAYPENLPARFQDKFASEVTFSGGLGNRLGALRRTLGMDDVRQSFEAVLDEFQPDVVHLHNIHSYLSPVVGQMAHRRGIRVVWTLHDYKLLCPRYDCLRDGKPCEQCVAGDKNGVIEHRCMKGSLPASAVAKLEAIKWNRRILEQNTDLFVCPSRFMANMMKKGGFDDSKTVVLNNFLDPVKLEQYQGLDNAAPREDYYCYVGRLSSEKGVEDLLAAAARLPYKLKVAGGGPLESQLRQRYAGNDNIEFLGIIDAVEVARLLAGARLSVVPSQCYDNNPLSVVESLCAGTPVAGSFIGGIPELIDGNNGCTFKAFDQQAIADAVTVMMKREWDYSKIAADALKRFSPAAHLSVLTKEIYGF